MGINNPYFPTTVLNETEAIQYLGMMMKAIRTGSYTAVTGSPTLTAAQMVDGAVEISGGTTATVTTPTAAQIIAQMKVVDPNADVNSTANFALVNDNSGALTFAMGTNVTLVDPVSPTIAAGAAKRYLIKILTATTVSVTRL